MIMTDNEVLLACRTSVAVLIPPAVRASHEDSLAFYTQITAHSVRIRQSHYYVPAARKFRPSPERSSVCGEQILHTS